jgi:hypothetical protein
MTSAEEERQFLMYRDFNQALSESITKPSVDEEIMIGLKTSSNGEFNFINLTFERSQDTVVPDKGSDS